MTDTTTTETRGIRTLSDVDPDVARLIANEGQRQREGLQLIASENLVSAAVREAVGSVFTDKYAGNKFANYLFRVRGNGFTEIDAEEAHKRIEEANLFIEAAHSCYQRMEPPAPA